jgi:exopolysaccharide biosynthesis polyprenyl glycosylphosphotransferase
LDRERKRSLAIGLGDGFLVPLAYAGAYFIRFGTIAPFKVYFSPVFLLMMTAGYLAVFYFFDLYALYRKLKTRTLVAHVALAVGASAFLASFLKYIFFLIPIGRGILVIANTLLVILIFVWRRVGFTIFRLIEKPSPVLILERGKGAAEIADLLRAHAKDYELIGFLAEEGDTGAGIGPILGNSHRLLEILEMREVKIIVRTETSEGVALTAVEILRAHHRAVEVIDVSEMYQRLEFRIPIDFIKDESSFLNTKGFSLANNLPIGKIKRAFDIALAGGLFVVGLPLWPLIALLIKIESRGPVFYSQRRVGKNGTEFRLHKFRSMVENAENAAPVWAKENDHRVTRVGRVLRVLHLDELPQLWNVLRGEMSLVGPRPERPEFVAGLQREIPFYALRHFVKPGLTGWAQINYPYAASTKDSKEKLEYDLFYISKMSIVFDLKILIETLSGVFPGRRG